MAKFNVQNFYTKNKPLFIGGAVLVGGVILFFVLRGGGGAAASTGGGPSGPSEALQAANLQASTQLQGQQMAVQGEIALATLAAQSRAQEMQLQMLGLQQQTAAQLQLADIQSERELAAILAQTNAQKEMQTMALDSQTQIALMQEKSALQRDQIISATQLGMQQMQSQTVLEASRIQMEGASQQAYYANEALAKQIAAQVQISGQQSQIAMAQIQSNTDQAALFTQLGITQITAQTQQNADMLAAQRDIAAMNNKTEQKKSKNSLIGGIIGGALSLFSDPRLKENIIQIGETENGNPLYRYNYRPGVTGWRSNRQLVQVGEMATEVAWREPHRLGFDHSGYATVSYGAA